MLHYFSSLKKFPTIKVLTGQTRGSYNPVVMMYELIIQILWTEIFSVILIIQLVLTITHYTIILLPSHVQNCDFICKYKCTSKDVQNWITSSWSQDHTSSPLWQCVLDTLYSVWHKDRSESTSNGRAFGMNPEVLGWHPPTSETFLSQKKFVTKKKFSRSSILHQLK